MREIKFRGLNKAGVWVYGDLIQTKPNKVDGGFTCWIKERGFLGLGAVSTPTAAFVEVETKTVGQLTGLIDKNGVEIYEGDRLFFNVRKDDRVIDSQAFSNERGVADLSPTGTYFGQWDSVYCTNTTVIGNIHQNPEPLEQNDE